MSSDTCTLTGSDECNSRWPLEARDEPCPQVSLLINRVSDNVGGVNHFLKHTFAVHSWKSAISLSLEQVRSKPGSHRRRRTLDAASVEHSSALPSKVRKPEDLPAIHAYKTACRQDLRGGHPVGRDE
jgi:hypothetical protein